MTFNIVFYSAAVVTSVLCFPPPSLRFQYVSKLQDTVASYQQQYLGFPKYVHSSSRVDQTSLTSTYFGPFPCHAERPLFKGRSLLEAARPPRRSKEAAFSKIFDFDDVRTAFKSFLSNEQLLEGSWQRRFDDSFSVERRWEVSKRGTTTYLRVDIILQRPELSHGKFGKKKYEIQCGNFEEQVSFLHLKLK